MNKNKFIFLFAIGLAGLLVAYILLTSTVLESTRIQVDPSTINTTPTSSVNDTEENDNIESLDNDLENLQLPEDDDLSDENLGL